LTWEPKPSSPASFNAVDALLSSVHGDPVYGWMEHFVHMYPNQYFNTAAFCAIGPSTIPPLVLTDFINLFPMGTDQWQEQEVTIAAKVNAALRDRLFGAMCQQVAVGGFCEYTEFNADVSWSDPNSVLEVPITARSGLSQINITFTPNVGSRYSTRVETSIQAQIFHAANTVYTQSFGPGAGNTSGLEAAGGLVWMMSPQITGETISGRLFIVQNAACNGDEWTPTPQVQPTDLPDRTVPPTNDITDVGPLLFNLEEKLERALAFIQHTNSVLSPQTPITIGAPVVSQPIDHAFPPGTPNVPNEAYGRPSNAVGLIVNCTTIPAELARYGVEPLYYPSLVHLLPITPLGPLEGIRITRNPQVIPSLDRNADSVVLDTQPGVVATVQWLIAPF